MRTSMAYFAGAGTVVVAIAAGLGGGLLIANMVNPHSNTREMTKLEQRMSSKPIPVSNAPSEPVPYLTPASPAAPEPAQNPPQNQAANAVTTQARPADTTVANNVAAKVQPSNAAQQPAPSTTTQAAAPESTKPPEDAFARTRDSDVRREARRAEEKRRAERRQQWAERRRYRDRQDQELRDVEQKVREATEPTQVFAAEPARIETPRIKLFGDD